MMHDGMQYDPIQGQIHEPFKVGNPAIFKSYPLCHLQWELATDHCFDWAGVLIFVVVLVLHDFECGRKVSCEELTISPVRG